MHTALVQRVQVDGQGGDQGLALTRLHFGDPAEVQGHAPHELHVEMALPEHPPGPFTHDGIGLDQQVVECLALVQAFAELHRLVGQFGIAQTLHFRLQRRDRLDQLSQPPDLLALASLENLGEHAHDQTILPVRWASPGVVALANVIGLRAADLVFDPTLACCKVDVPAPALHEPVGPWTQRRLYGTHHLVATGPEDRDSLGRAYL